MDKRIDLQVVSNWIFLGRLKFDLEFNKWYDELEDDPNGVLAPREALKEKAYKHFDAIEADIVSMAGKPLPEYVPPVIPEEPLVIVPEFNSVHKRTAMRIPDGRRSWCRFNDDAVTPGSKFGKNILVEWSNGETMRVPNGAIDYAPHGSAGNAWICGTMSPRHESQGTTGGVWGPKDAQWYEIHYNK